MLSCLRLTLLAFAALGVMFIACSTQPPSARPPHTHYDSGPPAVCAPATSDAPATLQKRSGYQQVALAVKDPAGHQVSNLDKDDFFVSRGDDVIAVQFAEYVLDGPTSVVILVDTSGSTLAKLPQMRDAITQIVDDLDPRDDVSLFAFSNKPYNLQPFTTDHARIIARESLLHAFGPTSLYDSVVMAATYLEQGCYARRALVVMSDGIDNTSNKNLADARGVTHSNSVSVYAIAIGATEPPASKQHGFLAAFAPNRDENSVDEESLAQLAAPTGGETFKIAEVGDHDLIAAMAKSIIESSHGQYVIGVVDPSKTDSAAAKIQIEGHPDYIVTMQPPVSSTPAASPAPGASPK